MSKRFTFLADTVNGEILETPMEFEMACDGVQVVGMLIVRDYDDGVNFIIARNIFAILYNGNVLGSLMFSSSTDFYNWLSGQCQCCPEPCPVFFNGCPVVFNGCPVYVLRQPLFVN